VITIRRSKKNWYMFLDENTALAIHANYPDVVYGVSELEDKMDIRKQPTSSKMWM